MGVISLDDKVLDLPAVDAAALFPRNLQLGERPRLALELCLKGIDVVDVDVGVSHDVCEASRHQVAHVGEHVREKRVACNVEGDAEAHVAGPLVELAVEVALWLVLLRGLGGVDAPAAARVRDVELGEHVARRQGHALEVARVPRAEDHPPVVGVGAQLVDDLGQLVDTLARVVSAGVDVLGAKVPPLEAVDGAQVADVAVRQADAVEELAGAVAVPDLDADVAEGLGRGVALDEPEELGDDGAEEDTLRGEEGEDRAAVVVELELEAWGGEDGQGSCSCAGGGLSVWVCSVRLIDLCMHVTGGLPIGSSLTLV